MGNSCGAERVDPFPAAEPVAQAETLEDLERYCREEGMDLQATTPAATPTPSIMARWEAEIAALDNPASTDACPTDRSPRRDDSTTAGLRRAAEELQRSVLRLRASLRIRQRVTTQSLGAPRDQGGTHLLRDGNREGMNAPLGHSPALWENKNCEDATRPPPGPRRTARPPPSPMAGRTGHTGTAQPSSGGPNHCLPKYLQQRSPPRFGPTGTSTTCRGASCTSTTIHLVLVVADHRLRATHTARHDAALDER